MKDLFKLVKPQHKSFKLFLLIGLLSICFGSCINNEKIETYRDNGETKYKDLIKQMEAKYSNEKTDTSVIDLKE